MYNCTCSIERNTHHSSIINAYTAYHSSIHTTRHAEYNTHFIFLSLKCVEEYLVSVTKLLIAVVFLYHTRPGPGSVAYIWIPLMKHQDSYTGWMSSISHNYKQAVAGLYPAICFSTEERFVRRSRLLCYLLTWWHAPRHVAIAHNLTMRW